MRITRRSSTNIPQGSILLNGELVSEETLQKRAEPVKKPGKPLWIRLISQHYLWIWLLGAGGIGALVSPHWKAIDPYAPWLNEIMHGNVTDQRDVDYQEYRFWQGRDAFAKARAACDGSASTIGKCLALQADEPVLNDMSNRLGKLRGALQQASDEPEATPACQEDGNATLAAASQYIADEEQVINFIRNANLQSVQGQAALQAQLAEFRQEEQATAARLHGNQLWPNSCPALSHH
jgi:hypothetical protein